MGAWLRAARAPGRRLGRRRPSRAGPAAGGPGPAAAVRWRRRGFSALRFDRSPWGSGGRGSCEGCSRDEDGAGSWPPRAQAGGARGPGSPSCGLYPRPCGPARGADLCRRRSPAGRSRRAVRTSPPGSFRSPRGTKGLGVTVTRSALGGGVGRAGVCVAPSRVWPRVFSAEGFALFCLS